LIDAVLERLTEVGKVERPPTMDGKKMTALIYAEQGGGQCQADGG
jgi:hypothetical protein